MKDVNGKLLWPGDLVRDDNDRYRLYFEPDRGYMLCSQITGQTQRAADVPQLRLETDPQLLAEEYLLLNLSIERRPIICDTAKSNKRDSLSQKLIANIKSHQSKR